MLILHIANCCYCPQALCTGIEKPTCPKALKIGQMDQSSDGCLSLIISKSKQVAGLELGILREKVVLYKTGQLLQASVAPIVCKFEIKKN